MKYWATKGILAMEKMWDIKLYRTAKGWKVRLEGDGQRAVIGNGATPHAAYRAAECQLVKKPWLTSTE
mgnify:CR=1 FL=1